MLPTSSPEGLPKPVAALFTLFDEFEGPAYRYMEVQNARFLSAPEAEKVDVIVEVGRGKSYLDALRVNSRFMHRLLEECRAGAGMNATGKRSPATPPCWP